MKLEPVGNTVIGRTLAVLCGLVVAARNLWFDCVAPAVWRTRRFTVSVGGIHAGGTGKTPLVRLVSQCYLESGRSVAILSRGYGRAKRKSVVVEPHQRPDWQDVGDEPAMLAQLLPEAWIGVGPDRRLSAMRLGPRIGASGVFVLDDGFQHRSLHRHIDIVCLPPEPFSDFGIPAGYLREPYRALGRAGAICLVGSIGDAEALARDRRETQVRFPGVAVFTLQQVPGSWVNLRTRVVKARLPVDGPALVCGIARPERFVRMVESLGVAPSECLLKPDHHVFTDEELSRLAGHGPRTVVTTHKDACRLTSLSLVEALDIWYLTIQLAFTDRAQRQSFETLLGLSPVSHGSNRT